MKTKLSSLFMVSCVLCLFTLCPLPSALGQVPQGLNYQAVLRDDPSNNPIVSQGVQIRFTIQTGASVIEYQETHSTTTDEFGAISLVVGKGTPVGAYVFTAIDWSVPLYLKTEFEYPTSGTPDYDKLMGTTQLMAVPYSMTTDNIIQPIDELTIQAAHTLLDDPLLEVKNQAGATLLAVYNEGTQIFVGDGEKGPKGGFAIGSIGTKEGTYFLNLTPQNYFIGEGSGTNITNGIYNSTLGYYAGRDLTEGGGNVLIGYQSGMKNNTGVNNVLIGFNSGSSNLNGSNNIFLGTSSGLLNTGGDQNWKGSDNIFLGTNSGANNIEGGSNIFIGTAAGQANVNGNLNIYIGARSGMKNKGARNTFLGASTGEENTSGEDNIFIGNQTGQNTTTGGYNTFVGTVAGWQNAKGSSNIYIGASTASNLADGNQNVIVGTGAAAFSTAGKDNVFIGAYAGAGNDANGSIFIGKNAGLSEENGDRLYIHNGGSGPDDALIYGEFSTYAGGQVLKLNAKVTVNDLLHLTPRAFAPSDPEVGDLYFDSAADGLMVYTDTGWKVVVLVTPGKAAK